MKKGNVTLVTFGNGGVLIGVEWYQIHGKDLPCVRLDPLKEKRPIGENVGRTYEEIEQKGLIDKDGDCVLLSFSKVESVDAMINALRCVRVALTKPEPTEEDYEETLNQTF